LETSALFIFRWRNALQAMAVVILGDEVSPPGLQLPAVILLLTLVGLAGFIVGQLGL
jgi:hypothetical protein